MFEQLCLAGGFFIDCLVLRKDLALVSAVNIVMPGVQLVVHPDFQVVFEEANLCGLTDEMRACAVVIGIDCDGEIGVYKAIDLFEEGGGYFIGQGFKIGSFPLKAIQGALSEGAVYAHVGGIGAQMPPL